MFTINCMREDAWQQQSQALLLSRYSGTVGSIRDTVFCDSKEIAYFWYFLLLSPLVSEDSDSKGVPVGLEMPIQRVLRGSGGLGLRWGRI